MKVNKRLKKMLAVSGTAFALAMPATSPVTHAEGWTDILNGVIMTSAYHDIYLENMLSLGDDPYDQDKMLKKDMSEQGQSDDPRAIAVVDEVMNHLINNGNYVLKPNSLPYRWRVNNSEDINAACFYNNYVTVNEGIVKYYDYNPELLASTLAHEMMHGVCQHTAHRNANVIATRYAVDFFNNNNDFLTETLLGLVVNYQCAKNYTAPGEMEADEYGYYLMTSAGYNPGGMAAAEERYYEDYGDYKETIFELNDHPNSSNRVTRGLEWMKNYSAGHVTLNNNPNGSNTILIDGKEFYTAHNDMHGNLSSFEYASFVAGDIAKAFHDHKFATMWNFQHDANGNVTNYLNGETYKYSYLKDALSQNQMNSLEKLVDEAYGLERKGDMRLKAFERENEYKAAMEKNRQAAENDDENGYVSSNYAVNSNSYNVLGLTDLAEFEADRALTANPNNGQAYANKADAHRLRGDYQTAMKYFDMAVACGYDNSWVRVYRGYTQLGLGNIEAARQEGQRALQSNWRVGSNYLPYVLLGKVENKANNKSAAASYFQQAMAMDADAADSIPAEYK